MIFLPFLQNVEGNFGPGRVCSFPASDELSAVWQNVSQETIGKGFDLKAIDEELCNGAQKLVIRVQPAGKTENSNGHEHETLIGSCLKGKW